MSRKKLLTTYLNNMVNYISNTSNLDKAKVYDAVKQYMKDHLQIPNIRMVTKDNNGDCIQTTSTLNKFNEKHLDSVMIPNGSTYIKTVTKRSQLSATVDYKLNERKKLKKEMLHAAGIGDDLNRERLDYAQANVKINTNSIIGAMGSPYNLLYDKEGFGSVTSTSRVLIFHAYTVTERLIGGNFVWYNENEIINHINLCVANCPSANTMVDICNKFSIKYIDGNQLSDYFHHELKKYQIDATIHYVNEYIYNLLPHQITFIYYYSNLRHLIWENDSLKSLVTSVFDRVNDTPDTSGIDPNNIFKIDKELINILTVCLSDKLGDLKYYELPDKDPELGSQFIAHARYMYHQLSLIDEIFDVFIHTGMGIPNVNHFKYANREVVITSDTDSVIFTTMHWVNWYTGDPIRESKELYQISSLVVYWVTKAIANTLLFYTRRINNTEQITTKMVMKNEFTYTSYLLLDIKKHYAALCKIIEGVVLHKIKTDIKGLQLRSSALCKTATLVKDDFIRNQVLFPSTNRQLDGMQLIEYIVQFENRVRDDILIGNSTFLSYNSYKPKEDYKNGTSPAFTYWLVWEEIFSDKYGPVRLPTKAPTLKLLKPTTAYLEKLKTIDKKIYNKLSRYIDRVTIKKFTPSIPLNPDAPVIPKELLPIVDIRSIIYHNIKPMYLILDSLNLGCGFSKNKLLLSDIYKLT